MYSTAFNANEREVDIEKVRKTWHHSKVYDNAYTKIPSPCYFNWWTFQRFCLNFFFELCKFHKLYIVLINRSQQSYHNADIYYVLVDLYKYLFSLTYYK